MVDPDLDLVDRALSGDTEAFSELVQKYQKPIYYTALRMLAEHEDAADIAQQTFINAFRALLTFKRQASFKTWIYQIAINLCRNCIKERTRKPRFQDIEEVEMVDGKPMPFDRLNESSHADLVSQAIGRLPDQQRTSVILRVYQEYSYEQIADTLGCSKATARVHYHHGIRSLRKMMEGI